VKVPLDKLIAGLTRRVADALEADTPYPDEQRLLREDLTAWSLATIALVLADRYTVDLEPAQWWVVEVLPHLAAAWESHSEHVTEDCAQQVAEDLIRHNTVKEARVAPWSQPLHGKNGHVPPY